MIEEKKPIFKKECWECPECGWQNPYSIYLIVTNPAIICYRCNKCDYHNNSRHEPSASESFRLQFPSGRKQDDQQSDAK